MGISRKLELYRLMWELYGRDAGTASPSTYLSLASTAGHASLLWKSHILPMHAQEFSKLYAGSEGESCAFFEMEGG